MNENFFVIDFIEVVALLWLDLFQLKNILLIKNLNLPLLKLTSKFALKLTITE